MLHSTKQADVNIPDVRGWTPLMAAIDYGKFSAVESLLQVNADVTHTAEDGASALSLAEEAEEPRCIEAIRRRLSGAAPTNIPEISEQPDGGDSSEVDYDIVMKRLCDEVGGRALYRSKLMNVGQGRAGKTALYQAMLQNTFHVNGIQSTVGIEAVAFQVSVSIPKDSETPWTEIDLKGRSEAELAMARLVLQEQQQQLGQNDQADWIVDYLQTGTQPKPRESVFLDPHQQQLHVQHRQVGDLHPAMPQPDPHLEDPNHSNPAVTPDAPMRKISEGLACESDGESFLQQMDRNLVLQYINTASQVDSVTFSAWDYGGQDVFYSLHALFLTRYGVYLVVFNMEELADSAKPDTRAQCLEFFKFWLFSIAVHARGANNTTPPVIIVGTHKDQVPDPREHKRISDAIHESFSSYPFWGSVQPCPEGYDGNQPFLLWFYPVNNSVAHKDPAIKALMRKIETLAEQEPYIKKKIPFGWLMLLDHVERTKAARPFVSFEEMRTMAMRCGLPTSNVYRLDDELVYALKYLNELAVLMWYDEPSIRDLVILDPEWLIKAVTKIIRKLDMHDNPVARGHSHWKYLSGEGTLTQAMRDILWQDYKPNTRKELMHLMIKYGLAVQLRDGGENDKYLIPDLLKPTLDVSDALVQKPDSLECFFVFRIPPDDPNASPVTVVELSNFSAKGFLPTGVFARLLAKSITWCESTRGPRAALVPTTFASFPAKFSRTKAVLAFGGDLFMMCEDKETNSIRVLFNSSNPTLVVERLQHLADEVLAECFPNLEYLVMVPIDAPNILAQSSDSKGLVGSLSGLLQCIKRKASLWVSGRCLAYRDVQERFKMWLPSFGLRNSYDLFISYRWTELDKIFAAKLFDCFGFLSHGSDSKRVEVFLDQYRLQPGRRLDYDFVRALRFSRLAVPIVSWGALERMAKLHEGSDVDNLLLEWTVMLELQQLRVPLRVFPVFVGRVHHMPNPVNPSPDTRNVVVAITDLLADRVSLDQSNVLRTPIEWLPEIVVRSVVSEAESLLQTLHLKPSANLQNRTVRGTVSAICRHLGVKCDEILKACTPSNELALTELYEKCAVQIFEALQQTPLPKDGVGAMGLPNIPSMSSQTLLTNWNDIPDLDHRIERAMKQRGAGEDVSGFLKRIGLDPYVSKFSDAGYAQMETLLKGTIADDQLLKFGMQAGHIDTFRLQLDKKRKTETAVFLEDNDLSEISEEMVGNGYKRVQLLFQISQDELKLKYGLKDGHIRLFNLALTKLLNT
eukprot:c17098_g1_i2.p1 GENE.c17098_g1_i2~~c17098_g1_i2.p1  ORF type:complete len:1351 (+),score=321.26 c17098_g1_i2:301-4053(+)